MAFERPNERGEAQRGHDARMDLMDLVLKVHCMCVDHIIYIYNYSYTYTTEFIYMCMHVAHVNKLNIYMHFLLCIFYVSVYTVLLLIDHTSHVVFATFVLVWP